MSQETVELVRSFYERGRATGRLPVDVLDPNVEWHGCPGLPESGTQRGRNAVAACLGDWFRSFANLAVDVEDFLDRGGCVVVPMVMRGPIRSSDEVLEMLPETHVWKVQEGYAVEVREYWTKEEALEGVGLTD